MPHPDDGSSCSEAMRARAGQARLQALCGIDALIGELQAARWRRPASKPRPTRSDSTPCAPRQPVCWDVCGSPATFSAPSSWTPGPTAHLPSHSLLSNTTPTHKPSSQSSTRPALSQAPHHARPQPLPGTPHNRNTRTSARPTPSQGLRAREAVPSVRHMAGPDRHPADRVRHTHLFLARGRRVRS